jgi:hypothetical protein
MMWGKWARLAIVSAGLASIGPAMAGEMRVEEARRFVAGKLFAYNCFDGTTGAGRIYADGSVIGHIAVSGSGRPPRHIMLPPGTLKVKGDRFCAAVRGLSFEPCFNLDKTSDNSFRGSVSGLGFAYCDFHRRSARVDVAGRQPLKLHPIRPTIAAAAE